jgi:site-specific DNA recombinase
MSHDGDVADTRPSFSYGRGKKTYRYYVSECLLPNGKITHGGNLKGMRLSATRIEKLLFQAISDLMREPTGPDVIFDAIQSVTATPDRLHVSLDPARQRSQTNAGCSLLDQLRSAIDPDATQDDGCLTFSIEIPPVRRGRTIARKQPPRLDLAEREDIADLLRTAHRKLSALGASPLDTSRHRHMRSPADAWTRARIPAGLLAPDIQKAVLLGTLLRGISADEVLAMDLPLDWNEQRRMFGMAG